jgi:perosamine synthetase
MANGEFCIPWGRPHYWGKEREFVAEAIDSLWISGGPFVDRFERDFAACCEGVPSISCANGTAALHLIYLGLGIRPGDEIVVPGFGFLAAANVALHLGARPVFCDVDPETWCMRARDIEANLGDKTRAIVVVHTYGNVCEMDDIVALGRERGLPVIEDAAESFLSRFRDRISGTIGLAGSFSFHATKTVTTGEGGMVVTRDEDLRRRVELFRSHGLLRKRHYWHELPGHNFRLTNMQAAMGCAQLEQVDVILEQRRRVYERYRAHLSKMTGVKLQKFSDPVSPVVWAIALRLDPRTYKQGRDRVMAQMQERNIETRPGFYPPDALSYFGCSPLPVSSSLSGEIISLPSFATLTDSEIDYICDTLRILQGQS